MSRNRKRLNVPYPDLVDALEQQSHRQFIVDGEIVAFEGNVTSFARLKTACASPTRKKCRNSEVAVYY